MPDSIRLQIGGRRIENFLSYSIEADLYTADDAFSLELANPETRVEAGQRCELYINDQLELTGIVDRVNHAYDKQGVRLRVEGRDLCGLLTDSYCEEFIDLKGMTVKALAERLLRTVPYINRKAVDYQENIRGNLKKKKGRGAALAGFDTPQNYAKIEPGQTIFDVLKTYAASRGMMFYSLPDGTLVFGKPKDGGEPLFFLTTRKENPGENNILEGDLAKDISRRYSKVVVIGQQQGINDVGTDEISIQATVRDARFPFYKPYVATDSNDSRSPQLHAQMLLEKMRYDGFSLQYKVPGHTQNGTNWRINEMCRVEDEVFGLQENFLIYGRTFELDKQGKYTRLRLGLPGMVQ